MSGRVLTQHTRALPGDTAWRCLTSPPILITPYQAKTTSSSPSSSSSHYALGSRHPTQRISGANHYCKDTRPGHQLEAAQQHTDLCKLISAKVVTLHTILLG
eukprot:666332-Pelagomonas_calceolata.AAC.1